MHKVSPFLVAFLGLTFCQADGTEVLDEIVRETSEHAIYYELDFDTDDVERDGDGILVTTNLGYRVHVARGHLSTAAAQLVPCKTARVWLGAADAWAGHTSGEGDPSAVDNPTLESLTAAVTRELGASISDRTYCAGYLEVAPSLVEDDSMQGLSLSLELAVQALDDDAWIERTVTSAATYARQAELDEPIESGAYATRVVLTRRLASMFDDIAFDTASDDAVADKVLTNLLSDTEMTIYTDD